MTYNVLSGTLSLYTTTAGKVTVGLVLHWAGITDSTVYPPMGSIAIFTHTTFYLCL